MDIVRTIDHFGTPVLFAHIDGHDRATMLAKIAAVREAVAQQPPGTALVLTDAKGAYVDDEVVKAIGEMLAANAPHVRASAVVGLTPKRDEVRQLVAGMSQRSLKAFDDRELALDWLAGQARSGPSA